MSDTTPIQQFLDLSALLTGVDAGLLGPAVDPINIKQTYFDWLTAHAGADFSALLEQYQTLSGQGLPAEQIGERILATPTLGDLARNIMLLWYLGSWYGSAAAGAAVVSANAYTSGWAWKIAQAHPMGFSQLRFGYWSEIPPPLSAFVEKGPQ